MPKLEDEYAEELVKDFCTRFPQYYDCIVDMVETLKEEDYHKALRVMVIERIRQTKEEVK